MRISLSSFPRWREPRQPIQSVDSRLRGNDWNEENNGNTKVQLSSSRENQLWDRHRSMLILCSIVLLLSFVMSIRGTSNEALVSLGGFDLPVLCGSRAWFGVECPGCGLTRSFVSLAAGDFSAAFRFHRLGWLMFAVVLLQIPYRSYELRELRSTIVERTWPTYFGYLLIAALLGNWILKTISL